MVVGREVITLDTLVKPEYDPVRLTSYPITYVTRTGGASGINKAERLDTLVKPGYDPDIIALPLYGAGSDKLQITQKLHN